MKYFGRGGRGVGGGRVNALVLPPLYPRQAWFVQNIFLYKMDKQGENDWNVGFEGFSCKRSRLLAF